MRWYCFHNWTEWSALVSAYEGSYQYRKCTKCGTVRKRRIGLSINTPVEKVNIVLNTEMSIKED